MTNKLILLIWLSLLSCSFSLSAVPLEELSWEDLLPKMKPYNDPFLSLSPNQVYELSVIAAYRESVSANKSIPSKLQKRYQTMLASLGSQGINVDSLLAQRADIISKRRAESEQLNESLDKMRIRIPGYLLPLEYSGNKIIEFLLVPTVGACIHLPPPPPNQMVLVNFPNGIEVDSLYPPVWVEGQLVVGKGNSQLYLTDGAADVTFGYQIDAQVVVDYKH